MSIQYLPLSSTPTHSEENGVADNTNNLNTMTTSAYVNQSNLQHLSTSEGEMYENSNTNNSVVNNNNNNRGNNHLMVAAPVQQPHAQSQSLRGDFQRDFFGCTDDCGTCLLATVAPCVVMGQIAKLRDGTSCGMKAFEAASVCTLFNSCNLPCVWWGYSACNRQLTRKHLGIQSDLACDFLAHCCCAPCALTQEKLELQGRFSAPSRQSMQQNMATVYAVPPTIQAQTMSTETSVSPATLTNVNSGITSTSSANTYAATQPPLATPYLSNSTQQYQYRQQQSQAQLQSPQVVYGYTVVAPAMYPSIYRPTAAATATTNVHQQQYPATAYTYVNHTNH